MASYDVKEMWDSRQGSRGGDSSTELLIYDVRSLDADADAAGARSAVLGVAPRVFEGLFRSKIRHKCRGGARWFIECEYSPVDPGGDDDETPLGTRLGVRWSLGVENQRRLVAISTVEAKTRAGFTEIDFKGAVNVSKDRVEGVDVPVGTAQLTLTVYAKPADMSPTWLAGVLALRGKVNDDEFYGLPAGSLLFRGVDISYVYDSSVEPADQEAVPVPFIFDYSENGLVEVDGIDPINKKGWEYVWPYFAEKPDAGNGLLIAEPSQLTCVQVIPEADFAALGIGTEFV